MSVGVKGYLNYADTPENPFGLTTTLGWEWRANSRYQPFVLARHDAVYSSSVDDEIWSISAGVTLILN